MLRVSSFLTLMAVLAFFVIGQLMYFAGMNSALLIAYAYGFFLWFIAISKVKLSPIYKYKNINMPLVKPIFIFIFFVIFSAIINKTPALQLIAGGKNMLALWSVYILIALSIMPLDKTEKLIKWLFPVALIQIPLVLYQYIIVVPTRSNAGGLDGVSWDAIVGSFGGDPNGGGASGTMAFSLISACLLAFALWRRKQFNILKMSAIFVTAALCVGLAEVKVVVLLFPLGMAVLSLPLVVKKPILALSSMIIISTLMVGLLYLYGAVHYADTGVELNSFDDVIDNAFGYSLDDGLINDDTGEMGRTTAFTFWWDHGFLPDIVHGIFGYGPGASRSVSTFAVGEVARRYAFGIDRSAGVQLLWEVGVLGFLAFVFVLIRGAVLAYKAARKTVADPVRQALLETSSAILVMMLVMLPYSRELLEVPALSFLMMLCLGYAAQITVLRQVTSSILKGRSSQ